MRRSGVRSSSAPPLDRGPRVVLPPVAPVPPRLTLAKPKLGFMTMTIKPKKHTPRDSAVEMTQLVLPGDANLLGGVFGGTVMAWVDIAGAIAARRHCGHIAVTAGVDAMAFIAPIMIGHIANVRAMVNWTGHTSMVVGVRVDGENPETGERYHTLTAYLTYVAIDRDRRPIPVPPVVPETAEEKRRFNNAVKQRAARLKLKKELVSK